MSGIIIIFTMEVNSCLQEWTAILKQEDAGKRLHAGRMVQMTFDLRCLVLWLPVACCIACSSPEQKLVSWGDMTPPVPLNARMEDGQTFAITFDEPIEASEDSFSVEPPVIKASALAQKAKVRIRLDPRPSPGQDITIQGDVADVCGNMTRVQFQTKGKNDHPALLLLNEVQTGKNSSKTAPHRDYIECVVVRSGNLGGVTLRWTSSTKTVTYSFPACEVEEGEVIMVHAAPEGIPEERDETGTDRTLSGGIDASPGGRDFWTGAGGIPDATGVIAVYEKEDGQPVDGLFYADIGRTGPVEGGRIGAAVQELVDAGCWPAGGQVLWEHGLRWKPSTARPLQRMVADQTGPQAWAVGDVQSQTPGEILVWNIGKTGSIR